MRSAIIHLLLVFVLGLFPWTLWGSTFEVKEVSVLEINSAITPATLDYFQLQFKRIPKDALILIKINTPGGLISTTKDIIQLMSAQEKPVAVWVTPEGASAASAGAIIASAAHFILMTPGTNMGAATPVGLGEDIKEKDGRSKAMSDLKAMVRSLSQSRNRPAEPFEEMIETAKSYTDQEALKAGVITGIISSEGDLSSMLDKKNFNLKGQNFEISLSRSIVSKFYEPTLGQKILYVLSNPSTAYFLFLIGVALMYFELQAPGGFIAGGIGICFLLLSAISFQVLPLDWGALALLIVGVVLLVLEVYITSYGLLALGGIAAFIAGSLFLFHGEGGYISIDYPVLISTILGIGFSTGVIIWYMLRDNARQAKHGDFFLPVGSEGSVMGKLEHGQLQIKVRGEIWRGSSEHNLEIGDTVVVTSIDNERLIAQVKKVNKE